MPVDLLFWTRVDGEKLFFENCYLMEFYQLAISKNIIYRFNGHILTLSDVLMINSNSFPCSRSSPNRVCGPKLLTTVKTSPLSEIQPLFRRCKCSYIECCPMKLLYLYILFHTDVLRVFSFLLIIFDYKSRRLSAVCFKGKMWISVVAGNCPKTLLPDKK